jgi:hypothetical protein
VYILTNIFFFFKTKYQFSTTTYVHIQKHHIYISFLLNFIKTSASSNSGPKLCLFPEADNPATENSLSTDAEVAGITSIWTAVWYSKLSDSLCFSQKSNPKISFSNLCTNKRQIYYRNFPKNKRASCFCFVFM